MSSCYNKLFIFPIDRNQIAAWCFFAAVVGNEVCFSERHCAEQKKRLLWLMQSLIAFISTESDLCQLENKLRDPPRKHFPFDLG